MAAVFGDAFADREGPRLGEALDERCDCGEGVVLLSDGRGWLTGVPVRAEPGTRVRPSRLSTGRVRVMVGRVVVIALLEGPGREPARLCLGFWWPGKGTG